jgi:hypothetical protein
LASDASGLLGAPSVFEVFMLGIESNHPTSVIGFGLPGRSQFMLNSSRVPSAS